MPSFKGIEMQILQHEIDSLCKVNDVGGFFDKCLIPQDKKIKNIL
jgi:hypothetical protein